MALCDACDKGNLLEVQSILLSGKTNQPDLNDAFLLACERGHQDIVLLLIEHGANDFDAGLSSACYRGHKNIASFLIEKGATNFYSAIFAAFDKGYEDIILFLVEKNKVNQAYLIYHCFRGACYYGYKNVIRVMIEKGADDWDQGLKRACQGDRKDVVLWMMKNGATNVEQLSVDTVIYLIENGISIKKFASDFPNIIEEIKEFQAEIWAQLQKLPFFHDLIRIIIDYSLL